MPLVTLEGFLGSQLDYIIVGGGTAGLSLAARLSEEPTATVGVIESGASYLGHKDIDTPGPMGRSFTTSAADFSFKTCPQENCFQRQAILPRGKALGGSSTVNFVKMDRGSSKEYDCIPCTFCGRDPRSNDTAAMEVLGNPGWNWTEMLKYFRKTEHLQRSTTSLEVPLGAKPRPDTHGDSGPLSVTFPEWCNDLRQPYIDALASLGVENNPDPASGYNIGYNLSRSYITKDGKRSYSASAYYEPISHRQNLLVLCEAMVAKIELTEIGDAGGPIRASGVHFMHKGEAFYVRVSREVIISCGALCSPQMLELSGIGNPVILNQHGIKSIIDLPGVGENLPTDFEIKPEFQTVEALQNPTIAEEHARLSEKHKGFYSGPNDVFAFVGLKDLASEDERRQLSDMLEAEIKKRSDSEAIPRPRQDTLLKEWQQDPDISPMEIICLPNLFPAGKRLPEPKTHYSSIICILMKPTSRGNVHIQSPDPSTQPRIDPAYLGSPSELETLKLGIRKVLRLAETEPWKKVMAKSLLKVDLEQIRKNNPRLDEDGAMEYFCQERAATTFHFVGSAAMLPRENGGVVDSRLKVYGTTNLRVVDASIIPMELSCHISGTVYAIAEKAADMIKEDWSKLNSNSEGIQAVKSQL